LEHLIQEEEKRYLFACILELGDVQKAILLGSVYFGLSDEELGRQLQMSRENVRQLRCRARKQIRKKMEEKGLTLGDVPKELAHAPCGDHDVEDDPNCRTRMRTVRSWSAGSTAG